MYKEKKVAALIAAAGTGQRMSSDLPKQFLRIGNKTILEKATEAFENSASVDDIYVIGNSEYLDEIENLLSETDTYSKIRGMIEGGATRQQSISAGIKAIEKAESDKDNMIVLVHDAARPYVNTELVEKIIAETYEKGAVIPAIPVIDTIKIVENDVVAQTLDRAALLAAQTPQGFFMDVLRDAYVSAGKDGFEGTDDASLVERIGRKIFTVEGDDSNVKITTPSDLPQASINGSERIGIGYDVHALTEGRDLVLGGVKIPYGKGLDGHSDADVLTHAFMDAILGALNMGDIGSNFPDNDMTYKDISSIILLKHIADMMDSNNYKLGNADLVIIAEKPKMRAHIDDMKKKLSGALDINTEKISIKATTTEGLGFVGRGEGIAAQAMVRLVKITDTER